MTEQTLWRVSLSVPPESDDAVANVFEMVFGVPAVATHDLRTNRSMVSVFFRARPRWRETVRRLRRALAALQRFGCPLGAATPRLRKMPPEDWAHSWKRHFRPLRIPGKLLLKPSWSKATAKHDEAMLVLDPGLSFGTGQHPTTLYCLKTLVAFRKRGTRQSLLDIGTGSGILAIAAAKLGYAPISAFDLDPDALRIARGNARENGVSLRVRFSHGDLRKRPQRRNEKFSLVCANLLADLLIEQSRLLSTLVAENGRLVVAGVLAREFDAVQAAFINTGLRLVRSRVDREWRSALFAR